MDEKIFDKPVRFMASVSLLRSIGDTDEALYFLEWKWPCKADQAHRQAVRICKQVLAGDENPDMARQAFRVALAGAGFDLIGEDSCVGPSAVMVNSTLAKVARDSGLHHGRLGTTYSTAR